MFEEISVKFCSASKLINAALNAFCVHDFVVHALGAVSPHKK